MEIHVPLGCEPKRFERLWELGATASVWSVLLACLFLGEKLNRKLVVGAVIAVAGAVTVVS